VSRVLTHSLDQNPAYVVVLNYPKSNIDLGALPDDYFSKVSRFALDVREMKQFQGIGRDSPTR
jgi:hypothetical protein